MAQVIKTICDIHNADAEQEIPGERVTITLGDFDGVIDLCPSCSDDLLSRLREALKQYGTSTAPRRGRPRRPRQPESPTILTPVEGGLSCPIGVGVCGTYKHMDSLRGHVRKTHGSEGMRVLYGEESRACPECHEVFNGEHGIEMHLARSHADGKKPSSKRAKV